MTSHTFTVPGTPGAKGRPKFTTRGGFARTYTPDKTVQYEQLVALCALQAGVEPIEGPLRVSIVAFWPMKGTERKRRPRPIERKYTRPDLDNVVKVCLDGMNGIAYSDDGQVQIIHAAKWHAPQGEQARTEITIEPAREETP